MIQLFTVQHTYAHWSSMAVCCFSPAKVAFKIVFSLFSLVTRILGLDLHGLFSKQNEPVHTSHWRGKISIYIICMSQIIFFFVPGAESCTQNLMFSSDRWVSWDIMIVLFIISIYGVLYNPCRTLYSMS